MYAHIRGHIASSGGGPVEPGSKIKKITLNLTGGTVLGQLLPAPIIFIGCSLLKTSGTLTEFIIGSTSGASDILYDDAPVNSADGQMYSLPLTYQSAKTIYCKVTGGNATLTIYYY